MMKIFAGVWISIFILLGIALGVYMVTPSAPKTTHPTFTQHQQLELRVERLEKIVGLKGKEARKEGLQNKVK